MTSARIAYIGVIGAIVRAPISKISSLCLQFFFELKYMFRKASVRCFFFASDHGCIARDACAGSVKGAIRRAA